MKTSKEIEKECDEILSRYNIPIKILNENLTLADRIKLLIEKFKWNNSTSINDALDRKYGYEYDSKYIEEFLENMENNDLDWAI